MDPLFSHREMRRPSRFVILWLAIACGGLPTSSAQDQIEPVSFTHSSQGETVQGAARQRTGVGVMGEVGEPAKRKDSDLYQASFSQIQFCSDDLDWLDEVSVGYDNGFVVASYESLDLDVGDCPFLMRVNGWGQLRHTVFSSEGEMDANQFQLKRARLIFSGSAFTSDFAYFVQLDGRSSSGDDMRLLDYFLTYDLGRHAWDLKKGSLGSRPANTRCRLRWHATCRGVNSNSRTAPWPACSLT